MSEYRGVEQVPVMDSHMEKERAMDSPAYWEWSAAHHPDSWTFGDAHEHQEKLTAVENAIIPFRWNQLPPEMRMTVIESGLDTSRWLELSAFLRAVVEYEEERMTLPLAQRVKADSLGRMLYRPLIRRLAYMREYRSSQEVSNREEHGQDKKEYSSDKLKDYLAERRVVAVMQSGTLASEQIPIGLEHYVREDHCVCNECVEAMETAWDNWVNANDNIAKLQSWLEDLTRILGLEPYTSPPCKYEDLATPASCMRNFQHGTDVFEFSGHAVY